MKRRRPTLFDARAECSNLIDGEHGERDGETNSSNDMNPTALVSTQNSGIVQPDPRVRRIPRDAAVLGLHLVLVQKKECERPSRREKKLLSVFEPDL